MLREYVTRTGRLLRLAVLAAGAAIVVGACGSATGGTPSPAPSATAPPPTAPSFQVLAVKGFKGSASSIDLYDSVARAWRTIPAGSTVDQPRFAGPGRVAFMTAGGVVSENLDGGDRRTEVSANVEDFAFSADGTLAYITPIPPLNDRSRLTIRPSSGQTVTVDVGAATGIGGVVPQRRLEFSPDGKLVLLVEPSVADPYLQVRGLDGSLRLAPATGPFVRGGGAAWSTASQLSFSTGEDLQVADLATGSTRTILPAIHAWNPVTSPDGTYVAYEQRDAQPDQFGGFGPPRLQLFDTSVGKVVEGFHRDGAVLARFVSPTEFFFSTEADSTAAIYRYDVAGRVESPTGMTGFVTDVRLVNAR